MVEEAGPAGSPTLGVKARKFAWRVGIPGVALAGGLVGGGVILSWGLVTPFLIVWPITLGSSALVSALGASWVGTIVAPDHTRSRLLWVVAASEAAAAIIGVAFLMVPLPPGFLLLASVVIIALVASWATWRFRGTGEHVDRGVVAVLALAAVVLAFGLLTLNGSLSGVLVGRAGISLGVLVGVAAVLSGAGLLRGPFSGPGRQLGRDAAATLGLAGLPAPVFFGMYYAAFLLGMTSG